jgi:molybdate transport system ATP-binding protein
MPDEPRQQPHLEVDFWHRIGTLDLRIKFAAHAPWTVLFGASGSGKSTILRAIAGLIRPQQGYIRLPDQVVVDTDRKLWVPPHMRASQWAGQRAMLLPHRTVAANIAFGMQRDARGLGARGMIDEVYRVIEVFGLTDLADRTPGELSGGQQQRVAVARAASGAVGRLLLLDEPFTGLDASVRDQLIADLRRWLGSTPVISVTHDVGEAFLLGAEVVRIADGRVVAQGPVEDVLAEERKRLLGLLK